MLAQQFNSYAFTGTTTIQRVTLIRAGGPTAFVLRARRKAARIISPYH